MDKAFKAAAAVAALIVFQALLVFVYRWKFHPLARYPGPWLGKVTDLLIAYHAARGDCHRVVAGWHERYGSVVRVGPNKLSFNSATALHGIYESRNVQKAKGYEAMNPVPGVYNTHTSVNKTIHQRKRKAISPAFSEAALHLFEPSLLHHVDTFVENIHRYSEHDWSSPLDITSLCKYFTLDVISSFGFGQSLNTQTDPSNRGIIYGMQAGSMVSGIYAQMPSLKKLRLHKFIRVKKAWTREHFGATMKALVQKRLTQSEAGQRDLFSFVLGSEKSKDFTIDELWCESRLYLIAVLAAAFYYMGQHPDAYQKLINEIRQTYSEASEIRLGPKLSSCTYLRAFLDETMRLTPPVGIPLWREVCGDGLAIDENFIPPGTDVGCSVYSIFHSEQLYSDPEAFIVERWLGESTDEQRKARDAFRPFSLGPRGCIGTNLAYAEMSLLLAKLLWFYDFRMPASSTKAGATDITSQGGIYNPRQFNLREYLTPMSEGPWIQFRQRELH